MTPTCLFFFDNEHDEDNDNDNRTSTTNFVHAGLASSWGSPGLCWGLLETPWGSLGVCWEPLGSHVGSLERLFGTLGALLGCSWLSWGTLGAPLGTLRPLLDAQGSPRYEKSLISCERKAAQPNVFRYLQMSVMYLFVLFV